jgi:hypothetical protein
VESFRQAPSLNHQTLAPGFPVRHPHPVTVYYAPPPRIVHQRALASATLLLLPPANIKSPCTHPASHSRVCISMLGLHLSASPRRFPASINVNPCESLSSLVQPPRLLLQSSTLVYSGLGTASRTYTMGSHLVRVCPKLLDQVLRQGNRNREHGP